MKEALSLRYMRLARGVTLQTLAHAIADRGVSCPYPALSLIERGRLVPTDAQLAAIADALGVARPETLLWPTDNGR